MLTTAPEAFSECVAALAKTDADIRLPSNFSSFDKLWREHWKGKSAPAVLKYLQEHGFSETEFGQQIREWNSSDAGKISPIAPHKVSLLELLTAHLAILEYRIRSFGIIIGHAAVPESWKTDVSENLAGLWQGRGWDRIFSAGNVTDPKRESCLPVLRWTGDVLDGLLKHSQAKSCYDGFRQFLMHYEVQAVRSKASGKSALAYKSPLPAWLRVGNLALPLTVIRGNLMDRHIALPEQKHHRGDIDSLQDDGDTSDPRCQVDDDAIAGLVARCKAGNAKACETLVTECDWTPEDVKRLIPTSRNK